MKVVNNFKRVEPKTPKSQKFMCNFCKNTFFCINYKKIDGIIYNICNYNFCPYCGNELFIFKKKIKRRKSMQQPEKCKINKNSICLYPIEECDKCPNNNGVIETTGAAVQEEIKNDIDPDIKNLFDALNKIKNICKGQKSCDNCIFYKKSIDCCLFEEGGCLFKTPERWEI